MLDSILRQIDRVYDLGLDVDIHDFLLTREMCAELGHDSARASVLVREDEDGDELQLGVYLGESTLETLGSLDLGAPIQPKSLEAFLTAIEEVSHFAYLLFSASQHRRVSQLELELQAEVDKFITSALLIASTNAGRMPEDLLERLFDGFEVRAELEPQVRERYASATSLASRYCFHVVRNGLESSDGKSLRRLFSELRSFYRLTQGGKIGRIHKVVYTS